MRRALPEDLPVLEVKLVDDRYPSVMGQVVASDYRITLGGDSAQAVIDQIPAFLDSTQIMAMKKTKSGEKEINIRPLALRLEAAEGNTLHVRLMLTEKDALKADLLVRTLAEMAGVDAPEMRVHRLSLLGKDAAGELRPLMEL